ncbi:MAG: hypothetical protein AAGA03_13575 [Planctomycetota bacterium]
MPQLPLSGQSDQPSVPSFQCIAYLRQLQDGGVSIRVANLDGLQCTAASERDALAKLIPKFKSKVQDYMQQGTVPWIDPPSAKDADEARRIIPVHL